MVWNHHYNVPISHCYKRCRGWFSSLLRFRSSDWSDFRPVRYFNTSSSNENQTKPIRRSFFEVFWLTHHLFIVFFAFLIIHGFGRQIRGQTNLDEHDPHFCHNRTEEWGQEQVSAFDFSAIQDKSFR